MASAKKNLIKSRDEYTRYYGDFRGVDFSSDHTQVHPQRLAYLVNMYKDYRSGEGSSLETIPGFRRYFTLKGTQSGTEMTYPKVYGLHEFNFIEDGVHKTEMLVHADNTLYAVSHNGMSDYTISTNMNKSASISFHFNNRLYIIDGERYISVRRQKGDDEQYSTVASGDASLKSPSIYAHVPTIYADIDVSDASDISKYQYEQLNLISDTFKQTYIGDGKTATYYLYRSGTVQTILVDGVKSADYTDSGDAITFNEGKIPAESAKVEITAKIDKTAWSANVQRIIGCTIATVFDKRVFLSGNPMYPNHIFFCGINRETGYEDPTYFGELDFVVDGVETAPITALIPVADTLAALKNHAKQDGSVYFHSRLETTKNYAPVTYPSVQGLSGVGCLGAALNFRDDPVFISQFGVEGIGQLSVRLERAIEHRSTLIDAKLCNLDLGKAKLCEFDGYLVVLCDGGKMFLGDSRQAYGDGSGTKQYEWYYCEGIGVYEDSKKDNLNRVIKEYYFSANVPNDFKPVKDKSGVKHNVYTAKDIYDDLREINADLTNSAVPASFEPIETIDVDDTYRVLLYYTLEGEELKTKAYLTEHRGSYTGGEFHPATTIANINGNLYFGTDNGVVCAFNFDKRASDGLIPSAWYSFDDRTIYSGCATKMDNCDVPHLAKSTIKKSTVIKTRALLSAAVKVKVRTDKKTYSKVRRDESVGRYSTRILDFSDMNFSDLDFTVTEQTIHAAKEQEKHWVEKQYLLYTDEYQKPLSLQYIAYRYKIAGRVKG